jgi:formate dehydrogenase major subunit
MSLSRRDFLKFGSATAAGVAVAGEALDLAPVEAAATSLKIKEAKAFRSVCPYCAVGCGQLIYAKDGKIIDIEGDPDTPHTLGRLCPKGAATIQLSNNPLRPTKALYRAPGSDKWEEKPLDWMYDQIARRYYDAREKYFIEKEKNKDGQAVTVNRLEAIASLGSACADNEECYLLSKLNRTFGIVYHEHQARV